MLLFALISFAVSPAQDTVVPYRSPLYVAPVVRPFEPPSNFGRVTEEGDGDAGTLRRPLVAPVAVEAYRGSYEFAPSSAETAYDEGVDAAERNMDGRMGPLDGRWRLKDGDGRTVMTLSLMDEGEGRRLEGAYRGHDATAQVGPLTATERTARTLVLNVAGGRLSLQASGEGWSGVLVRDGRERAVTLVR
ncbi:MAG: hypothetical protein KJ824_04015 [Alphaproteobacteria bacterium]|nr:hypothetical protein [Alphaproteobacteria bacterium]